MTTILNLREKENTFLFLNDENGQPNSIEVNKQAIKTWFDTNWGSQSSDLSQIIRDERDQFSNRFGEELTLYFEELKNSKKQIAKENLF